MWGWDEDVQLRYHQEEFDPTSLRIVTLDGCDIGTIAVVSQADKIVINKLYILPQYQRHGIGTLLVKGVLQQAEQQGLRVRLQVLKVNPARWLYERLGFEEVDDTGDYVQMEYSS